MGKFYDLLSPLLKKANGSGSVSWMEAGTPSIQVGAQDTNTALDEEEEEKKTKKTKQGFLGGIDSISNIRL